MFNYVFMQYAFIAGTLTALTCGMISLFVVTRKAAFAAHALSHISITGAALALLVGFSAITGQLIINLISAVLMGLIGEKTMKNAQTIAIQRFIRPNNHKSTICSFVIIIAYDRHSMTGMLSHSIKCRMST